MMRQPETKGDGGGSSAISAGAALVGQAVAFGLGHSAPICQRDPPAV